MWKNLVPEKGVCKKCSAVLANCTNILKRENNHFTFKKAPESNT